jgi:hypothetical protein
MSPLDPKFPVRGLHHYLRIIFLFMRKVDGPSDCLCLRFMSCQHGACRLHNPSTSRRTYEELLSCHNVPPINQRRIALFKQKAASLSRRSFVFPTLIKEQPAASLGRPVCATAKELFGKPQSRFRPRGQMILF